MTVLPESSLKSAEMYDPPTRQWRALPGMSVARRGCAAVCIDGNVYVVGGYGGLTTSASVESYDPVANEWRTLPSMSTSRWFCAAVACDLRAGRGCAWRDLGRERTGDDRGRAGLGCAFAAVRD